MKKNIIDLKAGLEKYILTKNSSSFKKYHGDRTCHEAYIELKRNLLPIQENVTTGAMASKLRSFEV